MFAILKNLARTEFSIARHSNNQDMHLGLRYTDLAKTLKKSKTPCAAMVQTLIEKATAYDRHSQRALAPNKLYIENAKNGAWTNPDMIGAAWADPENFFDLSEKEQERRFASVDGVVAQACSDGMPIYPYAHPRPFLEKERGFWGKWGTGNIGVSVAPWRVGPDGQIQIAMIVAGGSSGKDERWQLCAGHLEGMERKGAYKIKNGRLIVDQDIIDENAAKEMLEEMISGVMGKPPTDTMARTMTMPVEKDKSRAQDYFYEIVAQIKDKAPVLQKEEIERREAQGGALSEAEKDTVLRQAVTELRLEAIEKLWPGYMDKLRENIVDGGQICYAGTVMRGNRSTQQAWSQNINMASEMDDDDLFPLYLAAGDDALEYPDEEEAWKTVTPDLVHDINPSNQIYIPFVFANAVLQLEAEGREITPEITRQMDTLIQYYQRATNAYENQRGGPESTMRPNG